MPTLATLFYGSQTDDLLLTMDTPQAWMAASLLVLSALALCLLLLLLMRITLVRWKIPPTRRSLLLHNKGNVPGVFRLHAIAPLNGLEIRFTLDGKKLEVKTAPDAAAATFPAAQPTPTGAAERQAHLLKHYVETPLVMPGKQLTFELQFEPRNWFPAEEHEVLLQSYQVDQEGYPRLEAPVLQDIVERVRLSGISRWHRALKTLVVALETFVVALSILIIGAWLFEVIQLGVVTLKNVQTALSILITNPWRIVVAVVIQLVNLLLKMIGWL